MNCNDFEQVVIELTRSDSRSEPESFTLARQHAQICERCALRLTTQQQLSQTLREIALSDAHECANPVVPPALLSAFRAQHQTEVAVSESPTMLLPRRAWFAKWQWGAIAATTILFVVVGRTMLTTQPNQDGLPAARIVQPAQPLDKKVSEASAFVADLSDREAELTTPVTVRSLPTKVKSSRTLRNVKSIPEARVSAELGAFSIAEQEPLSPNDFWVFDYAENMAPPQNSQLIRVKMPREGLAPLRIPIPNELSNRDYVNADLLVGDGVPRAIRVAYR